MQFPVDKETVGSISFADELSVQVFPAYQGTIIKAFVELGAQVEKDQPLYTIKSPDLIQAESTLIGAAATFELTNKELERVKGLPGVAQREFEQATSDQQTADGALKAARDAVRVFGKTDEEIDQMIASRKIDPALVVRSPIAGRITSYNAPPGLMVQPGNSPAPYTVSFSRSNGCWRMSSRAISPYFIWDSRFKSRSWPIPTECLRARYRRSIRWSIRIPTGRRSVRKSRTPRMSCARECSRISSSVWKVRRRESPYLPTEWSANPMAR